ncbi:hypothetical protein SLS62_000121 [Diatrype stigma]|uniref:F-box domain-containing protein n=1 Tax=Diatrype stigma TaxID=117547 RepID=A0AAN9YSU0_9PEZI
MDAQSTMDSQPTRPKGLMVMPQELLLLICSYLTTPEYGMLRRSCKHLEASLFRAFAKEFFTKRQFMFTEFSLQALVDISRSRYGPYLTYLIIGVERPKLLMPNGTIPVGRTRLHASLLPPEDERYNKYREAILSHELLISSGQDHEMLVQALENLPNLTTIGMRDWSSNTRHRDGETAKWNSYGKTTFLRETGMNLARTSRASRSSSSDIYPPHVFRTILRALGKSKTRPERFEVILRQASLEDSTFYLPRYLESTITPVLSNLKALFLDLNNCFPGPRSDNTPRSPSFELKEFLCKAKSLEHLRLNFQHWDSPSDYRQLLQWLSMHPDSFQNQQASSITMGTPRDPIRFANLSRIDIGFVDIHPGDLIRLYKTYDSTLRSIGLHGVILRAENHEGEDAGWKGKINLWVKLLDMLSVAGLAQLSEISIVNPCRTMQEQRIRRLEHGIKCESSPSVFEIRWSGDNLNQGLKEIKYAMVDGMHSKGVPPTMLPPID